MVAKNNASMIEKSKQKKKINDEHSRNYDAGAVDVNERQLRRTGVRGRKVYVLLFLLMILLLLFIANLVILIVILYIDNINHKGMESISFYKDGKTKWHHDTDMEYVYPLDDVIGGYANENINIDGDGQSVFIQGGKFQDSPSVLVGPSGTDLKIKRSFTFADPFEGKKILHLDHNSILKKEGRFVGDMLTTNSLRTPRITSDDGKDLTFSGRFINITGSEGVYMDSKLFQFETDGDIKINIEDSKSSLRMGSSVQLDRSKLKDTSSKHHKVLNPHRYRLCGCASSGKLFKVRIVDGKGLSCSTASTNPCA